MCRDPFNVEMDELRAEVKWLKVERTYHIKWKNVAAREREDALAEVKQLTVELDKAWRSALDQGTENTQLRLAMIGASDAIRAAAKEKADG